MYRHPIEDPLIDPKTGEPASLERERQLLRGYLAQLWDQVWWISLPEAQRKKYESEGFAAPIREFYAWPR